MERFARDFVAMDKGAPVSVDGDKTQRARRATEISPVGGGRWSRGGGGKVSIRGRGSGRRSLLGDCSSRWLSGGSRKLGGSFWATAASSSTLLDAGIRGRLYFFGDTVCELVSSCAGRASDGCEVAVSTFGRIGGCRGRGDDPGGAWNLVLL